PPSLTLFPYTTLFRSQLEQLPALSGLPQMSAERVLLTPGAKAVGRSLAATRLRTRTGALVLSIRRANQDIPTPDPRLPLAAGDRSEEHTSELQSRGHL